MSTRCVIEIRDDYGVYRIYRHSDGYPEGVIPDLWIMVHNSRRIQEDIAFTGSPFGDPAYFLANFIFYGKLGAYHRFKDKKDLPYLPWEVGYGVLPSNTDPYEYGIEYYYVIDVKTGKLQIYDYYHNMIFEGTLDEAYEKFAKNEFPDGCHIDKSLFS